MTTRSLAQKRASFALEKIKALKDRDKKEYGNYRGFVRSLPATIVVSGLGQALAMELARSERDAGHKMLHAHLSEWLRNAGGVGWASTPYNGGSDLIQQIVGGSEADYIRAQEETMALLVWLKKFAEAFLEKPATEGDA